MKVRRGSRSSLDRAYLSFIDARCESPPNHLKAWSNIAHALAAYIDRANLGPDGRRLQEFPPEMAIHLNTALTDLMAGQIPQDWGVFLARRGRRSSGSVERNVKEAAVIYINACKSGLISDAASYKTVAAAFGGVSTRTLQNWQKSFSRATPKNQYATIFEAMAELAREARRSARAKVQESLVSTITNKMNEAGEWFRSEGHRLGGGH